MNWSLSKYGTFTKCPAKYKFAYLDKLPQKKNIAAERGIALHKCLEDYIAIDVPLPPELAHYEAWLSALKGQDKYPEWRAALAEGWIPTDWESEIAWLKSVIDLKVLAGLEAWVFDWKTGKIYDDHVDQKELYSIVTFVHHPEIQRIHAVHVYVDLKKNTEKIYERAELPGLIEKWNAKIARMLTAVASFKEGAVVPTYMDLFPAMPNFLCRYCSFSKAEGGPCRF